MPQVKPVTLDKMAAMALWDPMAQAVLTLLRVPQELTALLGQQVPMVP